MAWLSAFQLGRPAYELTFDLSPSVFEVKPSQLAARKRTISGHLYKRVFRTSFPVINLSSNFFTVSQFNAMQSLLAVTDTMLSFKARSGDFQTVGEICYPTSSTTLPIRENSATLLSSVLVAAGAAGNITINSVYDNPGLTGTNYYTGGSFAHATGIITVGTPMLTSNPHYVTYSYGGWLVSMEDIGAKFVGGQVDVGEASGWTLTGV